MLVQLLIRDYAIIDTLELEFGLGLTVLTGETGAGKSIVVDALGLVLGDKADTGAVRHGAERAEVSASFQLGKRRTLRDWLREHDLDGDDHSDDDGLLLRRVIGADGRSRGYVNGNPVPLATLRELGEQLIDIHGQHEHQSLTRPSVQRETLDEFGDHAALLERVAVAHGAWRRARDELEALQAAAADRDARLDLLRFQVQELEALAFEPGELASLETEQRRNANLGRLAEHAQRALALAYEDDDAAAHRLLSGAVRELEAIADLDPKVAALLETLRGALIQLQEGAEDLRRYAADLELDPARRDEVEARLALVQQLARKHRCTGDELPALTLRLAAERERLEHAEANLASLEAQVATLAAAYRDAALILRAARGKAATALAKRITATLHELGMPGGRFEVRLEALDATPAVHGMDGVELLVSANPGQPPRPLAKVASGGELSRIALAVQTASAGQTRLPTLVFDEVDAGIGGGVAEIVGRRLRSLANARQVLCVTHLPQVASQAHQHLQVAKRIERGATHTAIRVLDERARVEELARMLGGVEITETTRRHAREMLKAAND
jgi:DNA repair protein RecN (Recombination protein N)